MLLKKSGLPTGMTLKHGLIVVNFCRKGINHRRPTGTISIQDATAVLDQLKQEVLSGEKKYANVGNVLCKDLLESYLEVLKTESEKLGNRTYTETARSVRLHVMPFFGHRKAESIDLQVLEKYKKLKLAEGKVGAVTINRHFSYLSGAFSRGRDLKLTNKTPEVSKVIDKDAEGANVRTGIIKEKQYYALVEALSSNLMVQTHFVLFNNTGVRPAESYRLKWDQLDLEDPLIDVKKGQAKIKGQRFLALNKEAHPQLLKWREYQSQYAPNAEHIFTRIDGKLMTNQDYREPFAKACLEIGIAKKVKRLTKSGRMREYVENKLVYYDSRRSFRTFKLKDVNAADGKAAMGHTQDSTYGDYLNKKEAALRVLEAMDGKATEPVPVVAPAPTTSGVERIKALKDLVAMRNAGDISPEDFQAFKSAL